MKESADGNIAKWFHDIRTRLGTSSKSHELSDELSWTTVHASTRNKKQHLRQPELNVTAKATPNHPGQTDGSQVLDSSLEDKV